MWYFWIDNKVVPFNINSDEKWSREEWVDYLFYLPDFKDLIINILGKKILTNFSILTPTSGSIGVNSEDVPADFKLQILLMGVLK
jgi:hypothetical protein